MRHSIQNSPPRHCRCIIHDERCMMQSRPLLSIISASLHGVNCGAPPTSVNGRRHYSPCSSTCNRERVSERRSQSTPTVGSYDQLARPHLFFPSFILSEIWLFDHLPAILRRNSLVLVLRVLYNQGEDNGRPPKQVNNGSYRSTLRVTRTIRRHPRATRYRNS